jgi:DNA polymerase/3'-5' exonuclease PolX
MSSLNEPTADPENAVIAHTLHWLAVLLEIDDGDASLISAYRHAAHVVRQLDQPVAQLVRANGASGLEHLGFTPHVATLIADWIRSGELPVLSEAQRARKGLWPALTRALCKTLGIEPANRPPRPSAKREATPRRRISGSIERQVWESWN